MRLYHQCGHNMKWNLEAYDEYGAGDGFIISPVNTEADRVRSLPVEIRRRSLFDPQFYLPKDRKGKLITYPFFPANMRDSISTSDFEEIASESASACVRFQIENEFESIVIPTRYFDALPSDYLDQLEIAFVEPFCRAVREASRDRPVLLSVVVKSIQLTDRRQRNDLLNWLTGHVDVDGVYLILEAATTSKQIKDPLFLAGALIVINALKMNGLQVVVGYNNTEGLLYSVADPDGVAMGSYENLRSFGVRRFEDEEPGPVRGPSPRLYSGKLLQWVEYAYIEAIQSLYEGWEDLFEPSPYNPLAFEPEFKWHFQKPELYKHYFAVFSDQVRALSQDLDEREADLIRVIREALGLFSSLQDAGVYLDGDSDGSHLPHWLNALTIYRKHLRESGL